MTTTEIIMTSLIYIILSGLLLKILIVPFNRISSSPSAQQEAMPAQTPRLKKPMAKELRVMRRHSRYRYSEDSRLSID